MAESEVKNGQSTEIPKHAKRFTVTLESLDKLFEITAQLQENEDVAQPPRLLELSKKALEHPAGVKLPYREIHVILSTGSGHQKASSFFEDVVTPILDLVHPSDLKNVEKHITQSETSILELTRDVFFPRANQGVPIQIILASGDGGIVDLVNGLSTEAQSPNYIPPQVVLLPLGTANALYHSINAGQSNTWGLSTLSSTSSASIPTFTTSFSPGARLLVDEARREEELPKTTNGKNVLHGAIVISWGMHASLVADSDTTEYRKFGIDRFKMAAKQALYPADGSLPHPYKGKVSVLKNDEWTALPDDQHLYVLGTMVSHLELPFCISPASKPLDGSMHLVHFGPTSGDEAMRIMGLAYQGGKHVEDEMVRYEKVEGLRIEFAEEEDRWRRVCVDGKIVRVEAGGWVEVRENTENVLEVVVVDS
jgi:diacylglycerol kinase family enzyme